MQSFIIVLQYVVLHYGRAFCANFGLLKALPITEVALLTIP